MNWLHRQSRRDQIALLICGLCIAATLTWTLILAPLAQAATDAERRVLLAEQELATVTALAATLAQLRANAPAAGRSQDSLATLVDRSTARVGLRISSLEPGADDTTLSLRLDDAQVPQVLRWLHELESSQARLETLAMLPARAPGTVMVDLRMRRLGSN